MEKLIRYIASDGEAVFIIHDDQWYAKSPEDVVANVTKLLDPNQPPPWHQFFLKEIIYCFFVYSYLKVFLEEFWLKTFKTFFSRLKC
jgi:hypothetical protein